MEINSKSYLSLFNRVEKKIEKLVIEHDVNAQLYGNDSLEWILATEKIQEEVKST